MRPVADLPDQATLLELFAGDADLFLEVVGTFLDQLPSQLASLRTALESGDAHQLERAAHLLKGSIGNFGAPDVFQTAQILESTARSGNLEPAPEILARLEEKVAVLQGALKERSASFRKEYAS